MQYCLACPVVESQRTQRAGRKDQAQGPGRRSRRGEKGREEGSTRQDGRQVSISERLRSGCPSYVVVRFTVLLACGISQGMYLRPAA